MKIPEGRENVSGILIRFLKGEKRVRVIHKISHGRENVSGLYIRFLKEEGAFEKYD